MSECEHNVYLCLRVKAGMRSWVKESKKPYPDDFLDCQTQERTMNIWFEKRDMYNSNFKFCPVCGEEINCE